MAAKEYLQILKNEIHSTVFATLDKNGHPHTRVIDIMLVDNDSLYFITAKGKVFYEELVEQKFAAITGMTDGTGLDAAYASTKRKSISLRGEVIELGTELIEKVFEENPYMAEIYPDAAAREALTVFQMSNGEGEFFDLSTKPIIREVFILGRGLHDKKEVEEHGFFITGKCNGCKVCSSICPQKCINTNQRPFLIRQENCLHCGICMSACPYGAIKKK